MKSKFFNNFKFFFTYVYKSIIKNFKFVIFITFLFLALIIGLTISLSGKWYSSLFTNHNFYKASGLADYSIETDNNFNTFFSIRELEKKEELDEYFSEVLPFLELPVLCQSQKENEVGDVYINLYSSNSLLDFKKLIGPQHFTTLSLSNKEVLITSSFAEFIDVKQGDYINLLIGEEMKSFLIKEVIEDTYLFNGNKIYVNKNAVVAEFMSKISSLLGENFGDLFNNPEIFSKIFNKVYFFKNNDVENEVIITFMENALEEIPNYSNLKFKKVFNDKAIAQSIASYSTNFIIVGVIISVVFIFLIFISLKVFLEKKKEHFSLLQMVGKSQFKSFVYVISELIIIALVSVALNFALVNVLFTFLQKLLKFYTITKIPIIYPLSSSLIFIFVFVFIFTYFYLNFSKFSLHQHKVDANNKNIFSIKEFLIINIFFVILFLLNLIILKNKFWSFIVFFVVLINFILLIYLLLDLILKKTSNKKLSYLHLKMFLREKIFKNAIFVTFLVFASTNLLLALNHTLEKNVDLYKDLYRFDIQISNSNNKRSEIRQTLTNDSRVIDFEEISNINSSTVIKEGAIIGNIISIDSNKIDDYYGFDFPIINDLNDLNNEDELTIILPVYFHYVHEYEIDQYVSIELPQKYTLEFKIVGFCDQVGNNIAFSNINLHKELYPPFEYTNFIILADDSDIVSLRSDLLDKYSKSMVVVVHKTDIMYELNNIEQTKNFFKNFVYLLIIFLILTMLFFWQLVIIKTKENYDKLKKLGTSNQDLFKAITVKNSIYFIFTFIFSIVFLFIFDSLLVYLMKSLDSYQIIYINFKVILEIFLILFGLNLAIFLFFSTSVIYSKKEYESVNH